MRTNETSGRDDTRGHIFWFVLGGIAVGYLAGVASGGPTGSGSGADSVPAITTPPLSREPIRGADGRPQ